MKKHLFFLLSSLIAVHFTSSCGTLKSIVKDVVAPISGEFSISSPHYSLQVDFLSCEAVGNDVALEFILINKGSGDIKSFVLGGKGFRNGESGVFDNMGNEYKFSLSLGQSYPSQLSANNQLPEGVPVKAIISIKDVNRNIHLLSLVKISIYDYSSNKYSGVIAFRNVPIVR